MGDSGQQTGRGFQPDSDVYITLEDQQKINNFARDYAKHGDVISELQAKQNELKNLEDASEELILLDDEENIPFRHGEVFVYLNPKEATKALEKEKTKIMNDIRDLEETSEELKNLLSNLKVQLYEKFGSHINLED